MKTNNINLFQISGPIISDELTGKNIYDRIESELKNGGPVSIDFTNVITMATFAAKQIFGRLYLKLGSERFFDKVEINNANENIKVIIKTGILSAVQD